MFCLGTAEEQDWGHHGSATAINPPRPSSRKLQQKQILTSDIAAGWKRPTAQVGPVSTCCSLKADFGQNMIPYPFIFFEVFQGCLRAGGPVTREDKTHRDHAPTQFNKLCNELGQKVV